MLTGYGASENVSDVLTTIGCKQPLVVTDKMMVSLGYVGRIQSALQATGIHADIFDDTVPEPTVSSILDGVKALNTGQYDSIIAIGGGSAIDSAKALSILGKYGGVMRDYCVPAIVSQQGLPIIAIPTTAGTGSEVTRVTVITDESNDEKMLCSGIGFMPVAALIDYRLTLSLPARTTADTGIDSLTHAIEAYVSRKASLYTDTQAVAAMGLIAPNLRRVFNNGADETAREKMMLGATLAGVAFSNASVALVHGMSRPLGAFYHVPHGLSNAMLLPSITQFSIAAAPERYADCAKAMQIANENDSVAVANQKLIDELYALNQDLQVPTLRQFGIEKEDFLSKLYLMAEQALASGSPANNPIIPSSDQIIDLYQGLWA